VSIDNGIVFSQQRGNGDGWNEVYNAELKPDSIENTDRIG
jgi:hypothetical protein